MYYEVYKNKEVKYVEQENMKIFKMQKTTEIPFSVTQQFMSSSIISEFSQIKFFMLHLQTCFHKGRSLFVEGNLIQIFYRHLSSLFLLVS